MPQWDSFEQFLVYIRDLNVLSMCLRFLVAMITGALIGATRGKRQHAAGMRTHLLVCIGAACTVMVGQFSVVTMGMGGDPTRIAAQVVSGIGFLGAGSIIVTGRNHVTGLTTAAGLWASACMGIAAGAGYYECALVMCVFIYIALVTLNKLDATYVKSSKVIIAYIEVSTGTRMSTLLKGFVDIGLDVASIEQIGRDNNEFCGYKTEMEISKQGLTHEEAIAEIGDIDGVFFVEEMKA